MGHFHEPLHVQTEEDHEMKTIHTIFLTVLVIIVVIGLGGCETTGVTVRGCGVIQDSLHDVRATTRDGNRRLAVHYERGKSANCWGR